MSRKWRPLQGETMSLYSPIGLRLIDDFTSSRPIGKVEAELQLEESSGVWRKTEVKAVLTPSAILTYPGLERRADVSGQPARRYRVVLKAEYYIPVYPPSKEGFEFNAFPYNDSNPPQTVTKIPESAVLLPAANYPFPAHLRVLRGQVIDPGNVPVGNAKVWTTLEQVLTDDDGEFALPLRWAKNNVPINIDAEHIPTNASGTITVTLPQALGVSQKIIIL